MNIATNFNKIFWGLLLVILDFRIKQFDVIPDFVGYILVALGCRALATLSSHFSTAALVSWMLVGSSLLRVMTNRLGWVFTLVHIALDCLMMWFLLGGVINFASAKDRADLASRASVLRLWYVVVMALGAVAGIVARMAHDLARWMAILVAIGSLILMAFILHLIFRVKRELAGS